MTKNDAGIAKLTGLTDPAVAFEVEYSILFSTMLREIRSGLPPVLRESAVVDYIRATDGRDIPPGEYLLKRERRVDRVGLEFGIWQVLSWPMV